jgi:hypothetical protein
MARRTPARRALPPEVVGSWRRQHTYEDIQAAFARPKQLPPWIKKLAELGPLPLVSGNAKRIALSELPDAPVILDVRNGKQPVVQTEPVIVAHCGAPFDPLPYAEICSPLAKNTPAPRTLLEPTVPPWTGSLAARPHELRDEREALAELVNAEAEDSDAMIDDVVALSSLEKGKLAVPTMARMTQQQQPVVIDLDAIEDADCQAASVGQSTKVVSPSALPSTPGDSPRIAVSKHVGRRERPEPVRSLLTHTRR